MLGIIIVSLLGLAMAGSLLLVMLASKQQSEFRADPIARADALTAKFDECQWQAVHPRPKLPVPLKTRLIIPPTR